MSSDDGEKRQDADSDTPGPPAPWPPPSIIRARTRVFSLLVVVQIFVNFDSGAIAASLGELQEKYDMNTAEAGFIGSLVYIGLMAGTLIAGATLTTYDPKSVLASALFLNGSCALAFALASNSAALLALRFFIGLSQAFVAVYAPVWADEFAPADRCTLWLALLQGGVPLGITVGYCVAGYLTANGAEISVAFFVQASAMFPLALAMAFVPKRYLDTNAAQRARGPAAGEKALNVAGAWRSIGLFGELARNGVYVSVVLALCALFFVVTGLQLWITEYLVAYIHIPKNAVVSAFSLTSATAPLLYGNGSDWHQFTPVGPRGVLCGGLVLDRLGGYQGAKGVFRASSMSSLLSFLCVCCALPLVWVEVFPAIIALVWFLLFFGGMIVPAATGCIMATVRRPLRSFASSIATLLYNLVYRTIWLAKAGVLWRAYLCGIVAEEMGGVEWGFRVVMAFSTFGLIFLMAATYGFDSTRGCLRGYV